MAGAEIVVVGSYMRDLVMRVDAFPKPGETRFGRSHFQAHGGKGSNQAVQAARCGAQVAMVGALGDDANGQAARAMWKGEGIDTSGVSVHAGAATGVAMILVEDGGENQIVVDAGANLAMRPDDVAAAADPIAGADIVVAQLEVPEAAIAAAFRIARSNGTKTLLNTAPAPRGPIPDLLALTDILIVNELEAAILSGDDRAIDLETGPAIAEALGVETLVVTVGSRGAFLFRRDTAPIHALPPAIDEVVDTTGAGDAFIGAFAARLIETGDAIAGSHQGLAAGALACTAAGALPSFASLERIRRLARRD